MLRYSVVPVWQLTLSLSYTIIAWFKLTVDWSLQMKPACKCFINNNLRRKKIDLLRLFRDTAFDDYCPHKEAWKSDKYFNLCLEKTARGGVKFNNRDWLIVYSNKIRQWNTLIFLMSVSNCFIKMWRQQSVFVIMRINLPIRRWNDFRRWRSRQAYDISGALILERSFIVCMLTQWLYRGPFLESPAKNLRARRAICKIPTRLY